eukprot:2927945-Pleurochrysis_carterae.AAC.1
MRYNAASVFRDRAVACTTLLAYVGIYQLATVSSDAVADPSCVPDPVPVPRGCSAYCYWVLLRRTWREISLLQNCFLGQCQHLSRAVITGTSASCASLLMQNISFAGHTKAVEE